ncbi:MAG: hypothetical protein ACYDEB_04110 [Dehalococcoidia bacterium]
MRVLPVMLIAALAVSWACSGGGSSVTPTSTPPNATAAATASSGASGAATPASALTRTLLTTSDLQPGWTSGRLQQPQITDSVCDVRFDDLVSTARQRAALVSGQLGLFESVAAYPAGDAQRAVEQVRTAFASCQQWSRILNGGRLVTYTWSKLDSIPASGDEMLAFNVHVAVTPPRAEGTDQLVVVRRGNVVMILSYLAPGAGDPAVTRGYVDKADRKVAAIAGAY